jgi:hypothetical protein
MLTDAERKHAYDEIDKARALRKALARRTSKSDSSRSRQIWNRRIGLRYAMKPVRREIHRTQFWDNENPYRQMLLLLSADIQKERRKLWKLAQPGKRADYSIDSFRRH